MVAALGRPMADEQESPGRLTHEPDDGIDHSVLWTLRACIAATGRPEGLG